MKLRSTAAALALCALGSVGLADAQTVTCQNAAFGEQVTARFPRIREACLDITSRKGEDFAIIKADVARVHRDGVTVRFKLPDGTKSDRRKIATRPDFRVLIDGTPTRVRDLAVGQELTAHVKVSEPVVALAGADNETAFEPVPLEAVEPTTEPRLAAAMPDTASGLPLLALGGGLLLLASAALRALRSRS